jgi:sugar phosphate isomerase/epimerase
MASRRDIGIRVDDYRVDVRTGLGLAGRQGFGAVEVGVDRGEVSPANLTESGRRHLARLVANAGLAFTSISQELRGRGLADPARADEGVARAIAALRLAADMRVPVVSQDVGELLELSERERDCAREALIALAAEADRVGTVFAVRSSLAEPAELAGLVQAIDCPLVRVSVDPGAILMAGFDPTDAVAALDEQVSLAYVRDAVRGGRRHFGRETALGEGSLDLPAYLAALSASGCKAAPILRRGEAADPASAIAADKSRLERDLPHE